jgi:hypothetical protein
MRLAWSACKAKQASGGSECPDARENSSDERLAEPALTAELGVERREAPVRRGFANAQPLDAKP